MVSSFVNLPPQQLPFKKKNKEWRKKHLDFAESKTIFYDTSIRKAVRNKKINYDLLLGKLHKEDLKLILNPNDLQANFIPDDIQHYPIMNSKIFLLQGEERRRSFDYKVIVTNPNAVSEIEKNKTQMIMASIQQIIQSSAQTEEEMQQKLLELEDYATYTWQDYRERASNEFLSHFSKTQNFDEIFNKGFYDVCAVGEEIYQCCIREGSPKIIKLDPTKVRVLMSGNSSNIEDADMIIIEDYWSPGQIVDEFYDTLKPKDREYIENIFKNKAGGYDEETGSYDPRFGFVRRDFVSDNLSDYYTDLFDNSTVDTSLPYDLNGNIRVIQIYWKSRRKIKKVTSFDLQTGEKVVNIYPEEYVCNKMLGETEEILYINQAWEGTKIGSDIYINMRPMPYQFNTLDNPSKCHFGIVGSVYSVNKNKPYSLVDIMKPYSYMYDALYDRLNRLFANNFGKLIRIDFAKTPDKWDIEKLMYFAKMHNIIVEDSFKEGNYGASLGKIAGGLNTATTGVVDAELGQSIMNTIETLRFLKMEMSEAVGISPQREGAIQNRETVGGVERATLQSSHITEWLFSQHEDVKRRVILAFLEVCQIWAKGKKLTLKYVLSDMSTKVLEIDGDVFSECSLGLAVDNSIATQRLNANLDRMIEFALQGGTMTPATAMKMYSSQSLSEKTRMLDKIERDNEARQQQMQQQQNEQLQAQLQQQAEAEKQRMAFEDALNQRDNDTKILIAQMKNDLENLNKAEALSKQESTESLNREKLDESIRQFNERLDLDKKKLRLSQENAEKDRQLKKQQFNRVRLNGK